MNYDMNKLQMWSKEFQMFLCSVPFFFKSGKSVLIDNRGRIRKNTRKLGQLLTHVAFRGGRFLSKRKDAAVVTPGRTREVYPANANAYNGNANIIAKKKWRKLQNALAANRRLMQRLGKEYQSQSDTTIVLPINRPPPLSLSQNKHVEPIITPQLGLSLPPELKKKKKKKKKKQKQKQKQKKQINVAKDNDGYVEEVKQKLNNMGHRFFQQLKKKMLKSKKNGLSKKEFTGLVRMLTREQPTEQQIRAIYLDLGTEDRRVVEVKKLYSWCGLGIFGEKIKIVPSSVIKTTFCPPPDDDDDDDDDEDHHIVVVHSSSDDDEEHKVVHSAVNNHAISLKHGKSQAEQRKIRLMKRKSRKKIEIKSESSSTRSTKTSVNL
tara:strand:- start:78 stop:1208 length:1131 start_codon:yes stop_codon:yes gene_type:complete